MQITHPNNNNVTNKGTLTMKKKKTKQKKNTRKHHAGLASEITPSRLIQGPGRGV